MCQIHKNHIWVSGQAFTYFFYPYYIEMPEILGTCG